MNFLIILQSVHRCAVQNVPQIGILAGGAGLPLLLAQRPKRIASKRVAAGASDYVKVQGAHHESRLPWNLRPRQRRCVRFSPGAAAALPQCVPDVREPDTGSSKKPKDNRKKGPLTPLPRGWNRCASSAAGPGPGSENGWCGICDFFLPVVGARTKSKSSEFMINHSPFGAGPTSIRHVRPFSGSVEFGGGS